MTVLGAQYYRPPNPPRGDWRRDLERMKAAGMNTVKLWACWSWINGTKGDYDFDDLAELIDFAGEVGLDVVINTIIENAPYWLESDAPFARYADEEGRQVQLGAAMNTPGGGWPGLCFDNEEIRAAAADFLTELVRRFDGHPVLKVWDVWNEPHLEPASYFPDRMYCYCDASVARFIAWLRSRYGRIEELNEAWSRRYSDWSEVQPPRIFEAVPDMIDWREFWFDNLKSWLAWRVETVRSAGATKTVMTHVALSGFTGQLATHTLDEFTLTDDIDAFGTSSFPTWLMGDDHVEHLFNLDTARDAAHGLPFWQAEIQGGRGRRDGLRSTGQPDPKAISLWMWNSLAAGASGIMFWQWRPELLGPESPGYGLCAPDGSITDRVRAVSDFAAIAAHPLVESRVTERPSVGLLVSRKSALHAFATDRTMSLYRNAVMGAYRLLADRDVSVEILHEDRVSRDGVPSHVRSVYWPMPAVASASLETALVAFVDRGGRLVSEAGPGEYAPTGHRRASVPSKRLAPAFGVRQVETTTPPTGERIALAESTLAVAWQIESVELFDADVLGGFSDGSPAVMESQFGAGSTVLISSYPSLAYSDTGDSGTADSIVWLLGDDQLRTVGWESPQPGLVTRWARAGEGDSLVFAINWTRQEGFLRCSVEDTEIVGGQASRHPGGFTVDGMSAALLRVPRA
ncbi:MAG: Beta-galactosidase/beta-galactosidase [Glaciihabitans sp.]|nr:Beta-galactosidase/beta-galactosidase [Glaciihabitans sp.]